MRREEFAIKTALFWLVLAAALFGCQSTQYRRATPTGGFGEVQLDDNLWRIRFSHNAFTTRETAQSYWLYRAAELTISKGYDGFEVISQLGRVRSYGDALNKRSVFVIEGEIRMLKGPFESVPPKIYNAEALIAVLDPYVNGANGEPTSVSSTIETPAARSDGLRLKMMYSIPCLGPSASGQVDCPRETALPPAKPAAEALESPAPPILARPQQAPARARAEPALKQTGPCEVKPVMTEQDLVNCGARTR